jgi:adenylate cyclase
MAYIMLGFTHIADLFYGWGKSPMKSFEQAEKNVEKALALNDSIDMAHSLLGYIYLYKRQHDEAIEAGERAIELNPNGADAHAQLAFILICSDEIELAIKLLKRALRLNPIPQSYFYSYLGIAYQNNGQFEKAIEMCKKALSGNPDYLAGYLTLAASCSSLNRAKDARKAVEEILRIQPGFSLEYFAATLPVKNQEKLDEYINALRKAGLPE